MKGGWRGAGAPAPLPLPQPGCPQQAPRKRRGQDPPSRYANLPYSCRTGSSWESPGLVPREAASSGCSSTHSVPPSARKYSSLKRADLYQGGRLLQKGKRCCCYCKSSLAGLPRSLPPAPTDAAPGAATSKGGLPAAAYTTSPTGLSPLAQQECHEGAMATQELCPPC